MFKVQREFVISYLLLVVLPILALLGILKYGRRLTAPLAVAGVWKVQTDLAGTGSLPCSELFGSLQDASLVISQSGKNLTLTLPSGLQEDSSGAIEGAALTASFLPIQMNSANPACGGGGALSLTATVDPNSTPRSFTGTFSVLGCTSCGKPAVHGIREEKAIEKPRP